MKKIFFLLALLFLIVPLSSQAYVRYADPDNWEQTNVSGFNDTDNTQATLFSTNNDGRKLEETYEETLYAITNNENGVKAYQYDLDSNTWSEITDWPFLDDDNNIAVSTHLTHAKKTEKDNRYIFRFENYFAFKNSKTGAEIWKFTIDGEWVKLNKNGFGNKNFNEVLHFAKIKNKYFSKKTLVAYVQNKTTGKVKVYQKRISKENKKWKKIATLDNTYENFPTLKKRKSGIYLSKGTKGIFRTKNGKKYSKVATLDEKIDNLNGKWSKRLFATSNPSSCDSKIKMFHSSNGTDWSSVSIPDEVTLCVDNSVQTDPWLLMLGHDSEDGVTMRKRGQEWMIYTTDGFGNSNNASFSSADWFFKPEQGYNRWVVASENDVDGTEIWMRKN